MTIDLIATRFYYWHLNCFGSARLVTFVGICHSFRQNELFCFHKVNPLNQEVSLFKALFYKLSCYSCCCCYYVDSLPTPND